MNIQIPELLPRATEHIKEMVEIIKTLVDDAAFEQYKELYGQTILCGYARIDGWAVGIVANNRKIVKSKKGEGTTFTIVFNNIADSHT